MAKPFVPIRARVGRSRVTSGNTSSVASFTRQTIEQLNGVVKNMEAWAEHMKAVGPESLLNALRPTYEESQVLVPKDTGRLSRSGYLEARQLRGKTVVEIGYGRDGDPEYAPIVHENPDFLHRDPEQYKFLQQPLEQNLRQIQLDILADYKKASGT